jgi:peptidoglycan/xylan/chitin deacetylase (PgdA/CDA1 family)
MASGRNRTSRAAAAISVAALTTGGLAGCAAHAARGTSAAAPVTSAQATPGQDPVTGAPTPTAPGVGAGRSASPTPSSPTPSSPTSSSPSPGTDGPPRQARGALPPVISKITTKDKVVFITIDDGWQKDRDFVQLIKDREIPITVFLMNDAAKGDYGYFRRLQQAGALIEDHSMTHPLMTRLSYARQKYQICKTADIYATQYGTRPTLFRAPYGASNTTTRSAARACGMKAIFFWRETSEHGNLAYQVAGGLHSGDIILVHFKPHMARDFRTLLHRIQKQGYRPAALKDYLPAGYFHQAG